MENKKDEKKSNQEILKDIKNYLEDKYKEEPLEIIPEKMLDADKENFFNQKIIPVFKKIEKQLSEYNIERIKKQVYNRKATLRVSETLTLFLFKIDINNARREIHIFYELSYRNAKKEKLISINPEDNMIISFRNIDTINDNLILSLFAKWYMNKEAEIEKFKEWKNKSD